MSLGLEEQRRANCKYTEEKLTRHAYSPVCHTVIGRGMDVMTPAHPGAERRGG